MLLLCSLAVLYCVRALAAADFSVAEEIGSDRTLAAFEATPLLVWRPMGPPVEVERFWLDSLFQIYNSRAESVCESVAVTIGYDSAGRSPAADDTNSRLDNILTESRASRALTLNQ